jgi:hypothetical protein
MGEGDPLGLMEHRLHDLLDPVTDADDGGSSGTIEILFALGIVNVDSFTTVYNGIRFLEIPIEHPIIRSIQSWILLCGPYLSPRFKPSSTVIGLIFC